MHPQSENPEGKRTEQRDENREHNDSFKGTEMGERILNSDSLHKQSALAAEREENISRAINLIRVYYIRMLICVNIFIGQCAFNINSF